MIKITNMRIIFVYTNEVMYLHKPTLRVLQILELLSSAGTPMRLADISRALDIPKSTLLPILQTMTQSRYLSKDDSDRYCLGMALMGAAVAAGKIYAPDKCIKACLKELVEEFDETCYYGVLEGNQVLYVEKVESRQPLRMLTAMGHKLPAYATGIGKALLIDHTKQQLEALYPKGLAPLTEKTVRDVSSLAAQLTQARADGYAWEIEESTEHIRCFAVPVRKNGSILGAVSMAIPLFRYQEEKKENIVAALQSTARHLGALLQQSDETNQ